MSLLDFDDFSPNEPAPATTGGATMSSDPFDPFGMSGFDSQPNENVGTSVTFDDFDPFGGPVLSPSKSTTSDDQIIQDPTPASDINDPFGFGQDAGGDPFASKDPFAVNDTDPFGANNDINNGVTNNNADLFGDDLDPFGGQTTDNKTTTVTIETHGDNMADVSEDEQRHLEAQFDDLMGGLSNGDVTVTTKTTEETDDGAVITITKTQTTHTTLLNGDMKEEEQFNGAIIEEEEEEEGEEINGAVYDDQKLETTDFFNPQNKQDELKSAVEDIIFGESSTTTEVTTTVVQHVTQEVSTGGTEHVNGEAKEEVIDSDKPTIVEKVKDKINEKIQEKNEDVKVIPQSESHTQEVKPKEDVKVKVVVKTESKNEQETPIKEDKSKIENEATEGGLKSAVEDIIFGGRESPDDKLEEEEVVGDKSDTSAVTKSTSEQSLTQREAMVTSSKSSDPISVEYTKQQYLRGKTEFEPIVVRKTKKLQHNWGKQQSEEETMPVRLHSDQDTLPFKTLGVDYTKVVFDRSRSSSLSSPNRGPASPPVNYTVVEKVAPPEITKNVRHMFETGDLPDRHEIKKLDINIHEGKGAGVYENEPTMNENVVRETDNAADEFSEGFTKELKTQWLNKENEQPQLINRAPVKLAEDEGCVLESEPTVREDVVRESDSKFFDPTTITKGKSSELREHFANVNDNKYVERAPIKLFDENDAAPVVYENEPSAPIADIYKDDEESERIRVQHGKAANLKTFFSKQPQYQKENRPLDIAKDGGIVLESEPQFRDDVVRESDIADEEKNLTLEAGRSRNMAGKWESKKEEYRPKVFKMDVEASAPVVLENEPTVREDVVRESHVVEELVTPGDGHTRKLATRFLSQNDGDDRVGPKDCIVMERGESHICESTPQVRTDVVKCDDSNYTQDIEQVEAGIARGLREQWLNTNDEVLLAAKMASDDRRPRWKVEFEEAQRVKEAMAEAGDDTDNVDGGVGDEMVDDTTLINARNTSSIKNRWGQMREEEEARLHREHCPEPVRFTPPREVTPPPLKQASQQSYQKVTLNSSSTKPAQQPAQNGYAQPPNKTMTSKTVISLKSS